MRLRDREASDGIAMISETLLIRADASVTIGTGHVMRCLALAQAWQDVGGRAVFAMAQSTPAVCERLEHESCKVVEIAAEAGLQQDCQQTVTKAREYNAQWVVVDGYQFPAEYQDALKAGGRKVVFVDDYGQAAHYSANLVLNQNACADEGLYKERKSETQLLLGTRHCMLRREFGAWREWKREISTTGRRLLVTMGGSDPDNVTLCVIQALQEIAEPGLEAVVVVGGSNPHVASIQKAAEDSRHDIRVRINAANMPELMARADLAISAAGSTCWEMCALGLPALLICVAQNQITAAKCLAEQGAAFVLQSGGENRPSAIAAAVNRLSADMLLRQQICTQARKLVDFDGAMRVVASMRNHT